LPDTKATWLFDPQHNEAKSEYALTLIEHGKPVTAIMDRSFVDAKGIRWIIDYKTSTHEGGGWMPFWIASRNAIAGSWSAMPRCCASSIPGQSGWGCISRCLVGGGSGRRPDLCRMQALG
jgi:hypothetical protein